MKIKARENDRRLRSRIENLVSTLSKSQEQTWPLLIFKGKMGWPLFFTTSTWPASSSSRKSKASSKLSPWCRINSTRNAGPNMGKAAGKVITIKIKTVENWITKGCPPLRWKEAFMVSTGDTSSIYQRPAELLQRLIRFDTTNHHTCCQALVQNNGLDPRRA